MADIDVVIDTVGGALTEQGLRALGFNGRLCIIGFASGEIPSLPANQVLLRNRQIVGIDWGAWAMANPTGNAELMADVFDMMVAGRLSPGEPDQYRLSDAAVALRDLLDRKLVGKAALIC